MTPKSVVPPDRLMNGRNDEMIKMMARKPRTEKLYP